jgi:hypothetical protein
MELLIISVFSLSICYVAGYDRGKRFACKKCAHIPRKKEAE